jgi:hypothetical protein
MPVIPMRPRVTSTTLQVLDGDVMVLDDGRLIPLGRKL